MWREFAQTHYSSTVVVGAAGVKAVGMEMKCGKCGGWLAVGATKLSRAHSIGNSRTRTFIRNLMYVDGNRVHASQSTVVPRIQYLFSPMICSAVRTLTISVRYCCCISNSKFPAHSMVIHGGIYRETPEFKIPPLIGRKCPDFGPGYRCRTV